MTILRFDENGRKFSKRVENTVGKVEIAHYKQFLLSPQCFRLLLQTGKKQGLAWERVKESSNQYHQKGTVLGPGRKQEKRRPKELAI